MTSEFLKGTVERITYYRQFVDSGILVRCRSGESSHRAIQESNDRDIVVTFYGVRYDLACLRLWPCFSEENLPCPRFLLVG